MTSHELAKLLLSDNDAPISATVEIETGVYDEHGDEIITHLECFSIIDVIANRLSPNGKVYENIIKFEKSESRLNDLDVVEIVSEKVKLLQEGNTK